MTNLYQLALLLPKVSSAAEDEEVEAVGQDVDAVTTRKIKLSILVVVAMHKREIQI